MKKLLFIALFGLIAQSILHAQVQRASHGINTSKLFNFNIDKSISDTLWGDLSNWTLKMFYDNNGGYVGGNNSFGDKAKAQQFKLPHNNYLSYNVVGAVLMFGGLEYPTGDTNSKVVVKIYDMTGTGFAHPSGSFPAPGNVLDSTDLHIYQVDTNTFNAVMFPTPQTVSSDYAIGIDLTTTIGLDAVGLRSSDKFQPLIQDMSWEKWNNDSWNTIYMPFGWNADIDFAIFPIIDSAVVTGISEEAITTDNLVVYPNPSSGNFTIDNKNVEIISVELFSFTGQLLQSFNSLNYKRKVTIDLSNFKNGQYLLAITDKNSNKIFHKINLTK